MDPVLYQRYTKQSNEAVIRNLEYIAGQGMQGKCRIRVPYIPGYSDEADIAASVKWLKDRGFEDIEEFSYIIR